MVLKKRLLALTLIGAMVLGSSITAFATEITGATGAGTSTGHLNTEIYDIILPASSVDSLFAFTIDPEDILADADKYTDNVAIGDAWEHNTDLVYFPTSTTGKYASTSQAVPIKAKNYIDADVSVEATIGEAAEGKTIIPLVANADALAAATEPSLLLTLKVGTKSGAITADGATVSDTIDAQQSNFKKVYNNTKKEYELEALTGDTITWDGVDVQLSGKVKGGTVDKDLVAPTVSLTWTIAKHVDGTAPSVTTSALNYDRTADLEIPVSLGEAPLAATGIASLSYSTTEDGTYNDLATTKWTYTGGTLKLLKGLWASKAVGDKYYFKVKFDDTAATTSQVITITISK